MPLAQHHCRVILGHPPFAQLFVQGDQCAAFLGQQQHPGSIPVQPVHQFQKTQQRALRPQLLDHPEAHTAATVNCHTGGLVQRDDGVVFKQDGFLELGVRRRLVLLAFGQSQRRQAQFVARFQPVFRLCAPFVDPDLAATQDTIDVAFRHTFKYLKQVVIDPLTSVFLPNLMSGDDIFA